MCRRGRVEAGRLRAFNYGDAPFQGSAGSLVLNKPVVGMAGADQGRPPPRLRRNRRGGLTRGQPELTQRAGILPGWPTVWSFAGPASTIFETFHSTCPGTGSSSSPGCRARASRRWRSTPSTPRASAATSSPSPPTPASSWARWTSPTSTSSRGCRRPSPSTRSRPRATRVRRWAPSPRSTTTSACSTPASGTRTARPAGGRWPARPPSRSSTGCSSCPRGPASRSWRPWCGGARASTARSSTTWPSRASPGCGSTASRSSWPTGPTWRWPGTRPTPSRWWSTASSGATTSASA